MIFMIVMQTLLIEVLLVFISVGVTIIGLVLGYILRHFLTMKTRINKLWHSWFGIEEGNGNGGKDNMKDMRKELEDVKEEAENAHESQDKRISELFRFLDKLVNVLESDTDIDPPKLRRVEEDHYRGTYEPEAEDD